MQRRKQTNRSLSFGITIIITDTVNFIVIIMFFITSLSCFKAIVINVTLRCFIAVKWLGEALALCLVNLNFLSKFSQVTMAVEWHCCYFSVDLLHHMPVSMLTAWAGESVFHSQAHSMTSGDPLLFLFPGTQRGRLFLVLDCASVPCSFPMVFSGGRDPLERKWPSYLESAFENEPPLFCTVETYK